MKLDPEFILQDMTDGVSVLVPIGEAAKRYRGIIRMNETAAFLVRQLRQERSEEDLMQALRGEYDGTEERFLRSVQTTLEKLREAGALLE